MGHHPDVILAGRRTNDGMGPYIAEQTVKNMIASGSYVKGGTCDCSRPHLQGELRRSAQQQGSRCHRRVESYGLEVFPHDPWANPEEALHEYGVRLFDWDELPRADAIVAAVSHRELVSRPLEDIQKKLIRGGCFIDVKACFDEEALATDGIRVWRL